MHFIVNEAESKMIYIQLFIEFCRIGLLAIGGGLATIPFLLDLSKQTQWFSIADLSRMIAVSESTPGPLGVNMATFTGVQMAGVLGGIAATLGLVFPMLIAIILLSHFLQIMAKNKWFDAFFHGLRLAVIAMIFGFAYTMIKNILMQDMNLVQRAETSVLLLIYFVLTLKLKMHPVCFIVMAAVVGIFQSLF